MRGHRTNKKGWTAKKRDLPKIFIPKGAANVEAAIAWLEEKTPETYKKGGTKGATPRFGLDSVRRFVEKNRDVDLSECVFVPRAVKGVPASVHYLGKQMTAARYMCLLTYGTPKEEGMIVRHKCGNGHLSCINPAHLAWGTHGDNVGDANIHRAMDGATVEDKCRAVDARTSK